MASLLSVSLICLILASILSPFGLQSQAQTVPVTRGTYKFPAEIDPRVLPGESTELWAEVTRPTQRRKTPFPLVLFLHGNHGTCGRLSRDGIREDFGTDYTFTGECTGRYPIVVPNHEGYRYVAAPLAKGGVIVVSINANRGITANSGGADDFGLNLARGRLILKHLEQLARWNSGSESTPSELGRSLRNQIDFSNVGLMGHSRGGEGVRAALDLYTEAGSRWPAAIGPAINMRALFEIAPVDGQTRRELNVKGVASAIVLPSCDGDVSDLQGMKVFDRVLLARQPDRKERMKSTFHVIGANHNAFNTEWQLSDSRSCDGSKAIFPQRGESPQQKRILQKTLVPFFRVTLFGEQSKARVFDPGFPLSEALKAITFYERGYLRAPPAPNGVTVIQAFTGASLVSDAGFPNEAEGLTVTHRANFLGEHQSGQRTARLVWSSRGDHSYSIDLNGEDGLSFSGIKAISFRVALGCRGVCQSRIDRGRDVDIRVSLLDKQLRRSAEVPFSRYVLVRRPTSTDFQAPHDVLQSVDLPLTAFRKSSGFSISRIRQIRVRIVDRPGVSSGVVYLGQITVDSVGFRGFDFETSRQVDTETYTEISPSSVANLGEATNSFLLESVNREADRLSNVEATRGPGESVSLTFTTGTKPFPITNSLPELQIGNFLTSAGMVTPEGTVTFVLTEPAFNKLVPGASVTVTIGAGTWVLQDLPSLVVTQQ